MRCDNLADCVQRDPTRHGKDEHCHRQGRKGLRLAVTVRVIRIRRLRSDPKARPNQKRRKNIEG
jgi:hypothetical protein